MRPWQFATAGRLDTLIYARPRRMSVVGGDERGRLLYFAVAVLTVVSAMAGCGGSGNAGQARHFRLPDRLEKKPASVMATKRAGDLIVTLTAASTWTRVGSTVEFEMKANIQHALGAVGYQLRYGDGENAENVVPQFCVAGRGASRQQNWRLFHRYKAAGRYRVSASVYVNCSSDHATATVTVHVT